MSNIALGMGMNGDATESQIMNYVVRMVVPLRREFGRNLNVGQFLHDVSYAQEVLDEALRSKDARLVEYAQYVQKCMHGPRSGGTREATPPAAKPAASPKPAPVVETADEMRARVMKKYTDSLR